MREQIKQFCITHIKMEGFKRFKEPYEVDLGMQSYIGGENGQGKSTIADAIAFAFCGTPFWGEKSSDRLKNTESHDMSVELTFVDENGEMHHLIRRRNGNNMAITLDTLQMRQSDLTNMFAEKDIFLSILNPLYFIEKIATNGREFLQKLVPAVDENSVMAALSESTRTLLENEKMLDPEHYIKSKRVELKGINESAGYFEGQIDSLKHECSELNTKLDEVNKRGEAIVGRKEELERKQYEGIDVEALKTKQAQISKSLSDNRQNELLKKQAEAQNRVYVSKYADEIAKTKAEVVAIKQQCDKIAKQANSIKVGSKCPTCLTEVTNANYESIIEGFKQRYQETGKKGAETMKAYKELLAMDEKSKAKFEEFRAEDLKRIEAELTSCGSANVSEIAMLDDKIRRGNLTEQEYAELEEVRKQAAAYATEMETLSWAESIPSRIRELEECKKAEEDRKAEVQRLISAASEFMAKRAELTLQHLKMNRASIKLYDVVKTTGEIKDDFKFTYDGKDYRWLSASEKVKAGLEVSKLLSRLTGLKYPTYIDNAECITTNIEATYGQVILAYAKKNMELTVKCVPTQPVQMKEAA